ncbi:hypothetical protein MQY53_001612 [Salmonella enterica subsp. enterica]|nr:hypothetical protein [Salmonella enterica subsp. enterica]EIZ8584086.1 hypothetical protein [Salmonella enterica subsp. enterica]
MFRTVNPNEARERFAELVNSTEYDGQKIGVALTRNNQQIAFHRFDASEGNQHNWRGRLDKLNLPNPVGRPVTIGFVRKNISISPELWEQAQRIGNGNASAGISAAICAYMEGGGYGKTQQ